MLQFQNWTHVHTGQCSDVCAHTRICSNARTLTHTFRHTHTHNTYGPSLTLASKKTSNSQRFSRNVTRVRFCTIPSNWDKWDGEGTLEKKLDFEASEFLCCWSRCYLASKFIFNKIKIKMQFSFDPTSRRRDHQFFIFVVMSKFSVKNSVHIWLDKNWC